MSALLWCVAALLCGVGVAQLNEIPGTSNDVIREKYRKIMGHAFELTNPTHVNGEELYETDILLTSQQRQQLAQRKAIKDTTKLWPTAIDGDVQVPYRFIGAVNEAAVRAGLTHWQQHTCIKFIAATNLNNPHLKFFEADGCWSSVGMIDNVEDPGQYISLPYYCTDLGTVVHQVGHSIGFYHEERRSDRDDHVHINQYNILSGKEGDFLKANDNNYTVPYDFASDMHSTAKYNSINGHVTIATLKPLFQELIGKRTGLSHYDKLLANTMYPCIEKWLIACGLSSDPCQNDGYMGADCKCVCRSGTSGSNCETIDEDYHESLLSGCSENVTEEGTITSPSYPGNYPKNSKCVKWIQAPECHIIQLTFNSFQIYEQNPFCEGEVMCCYFEILEIRTSNPYDGDIYCDTMISPGQVFNSTNREMILYFESVTNYYQGWSADVTFKQLDTCTPAPPCEQQTLAKGKLRWTSPLFGQENYPNDALCSLMPSSSQPKWATIQFTTFDLQPTAMSGMCQDNVTFSQPYDMGDKTFCGAKTGKIKLPSFNLMANFDSDSVTNAAGFDITIIPQKSTCHKIIKTGGNLDNGVIKTPRKGNAAWMKKACEWWIESPSGTIIILEFQKMKLDNDCEKSGVLVNGNGDPSYPLASSQKYCNSTIPASAVSEGKMNILFYSQNIKKQFQAKWTVIEI